MERGSTQDQEHPSTTPAGTKLAQESPQTLQRPRSCRVAHSYQMRLFVFKLDYQETALHIVEHFSLMILWARHGQSLQRSCGPNYLVFLRVRLKHCPQRISCSKMHKKIFAAADSNINDPDCGDEFLVPLGAQTFHHSNTYVIAS